MPAVPCVWWGLPALSRRAPQFVAAVPVPAGVAVLPAARPAAGAAGAAAAVVAAVVVAPGRSAARLQDGVYGAEVAGRPGCAAAEDAAAEDGGAAQEVVATGASTVAAGGDADPGG